MGGHHQVILGPDDAAGGKPVPGLHSHHAGITLFHRLGKIIGLTGHDLRHYPSIAKPIVTAFRRVELLLLPAAN